ncbi:MAG TPA: polyprenyl synthetase family protein [bacterium]
MPNLTRADRIPGPVLSLLDRFEAAYRLQFQDGTVPGRAYFRASGAKRLRPLLFFLAQGLVGEPEVESLPWAVLIELIHTASLIHDDVVDGADLRRGRHSYSAQQGRRMSVLVGDHIVARALSIGVDQNRPKALRIVSHTVLSMTRGELIQNAMIRSKSMALDSYYRVIREKTASLFSATCELAGLLQGARPVQRERLKRLGNAFGMAYQIRDDILDFTGDPGRLGKPTGLDLRNGQRTLPFLLAVQGAASKEKQAVRDKLNAFSPASAEWISRFVRERNGIGLAIAEANRLIDKAHGTCSLFPPSACRTAMDNLLLRHRQRK